jgi:hypothetical protein
VSGAIHGDLRKGQLNRHSRMCHHETREWNRAYALWRERASAREVASMTREIFKLDHLADFRSSTDTYSSSSVQYRQDNTLTNRIHISHVCLLVHYMPSHTLARRTGHPETVEPRLWPGHAGALVLRASLQTCLFRTTHVSSSTAESLLRVHVRRM